MRNLPLTLRPATALLLVACGGGTTVNDDARVDADGDRYYADEDCDDQDATSNPAGTEVCDYADNNCDGTVDEGVGTAWYMDLDQDGYGDPANSVISCGAAIDGAVSNSDDCDDEDPVLNPLGTEVCDGIDNDCDGKVDWGLRVPADHALISDAVTSARDGETVCVSAGTYFDSVDFAGHEVLVVGLDGAEATIIEGDGIGPVVSFDTREGAGAILRGFTITGGDAPQGAGVYLRGASPTLEDLIITGNECTTAESYCYGTGLYAEDSDFTMNNVIVSDNVQSSQYYYYPYNYGAGMYLSRSYPTLTDVTVSGNTAVPMEGSYYGLAYGVGMYMYMSEPTVDGMTVTGNFVDGTDTYGWYSYGIGLMFYSGGGTWDHTLIADNWGTGYLVAGAGMMIQSYYYPPEFTNLVVANNQAGDAYTSYAYGGGFDANYTQGTMENADIVGNSAVGTNAWGGNAYFTYYATMSFTNTSFWGGSVSYSTAGGGGAIAYDTGYVPGESSFTYCNFSDNGNDAWSGLSSPVGSNDNIAGDPAYAATSAPNGADWDLSLGGGSDLVDAGDPRITDGDDSRSDIGSRGGPAGGDW